MKILRRILSGLQDFCLLMLIIVLFIVDVVVFLPICYALYLQYRKKHGYLGSFQEWLEDFWGDAYD